MGKMSDLHHDLSLLPDEDPPEFTLRGVLEQEENNWRDMYAMDRVTPPEWWRYRVAQFVLRHAGWEKPGQVCPVARLAPKECFYNAGSLAMYEGYQYVEGFAMRPSLAIPIHHAWVERDGKVIDPTWDRPEECLYLGVPFDTKFMCNWTRAKGYWGLLDNGFGANIDVMRAYDAIKEEEGFEARQV